MRKSLLLVLLAAVGLPSLAFAAPIYRCAGPAGGTVFSQVPCGKDAATVGASGARTSPAGPAADASSDKATLAEIDSRCEARSRKILDGYNARFAEANASIADLHKQLVVSGPSGAEKSPSVQKQIEAVESRKTELLGAQDRELSDLRNQCEVERSTELKREADRDAARSVARR
jgi:hypothetical protein